MIVVRTKMGPHPIRTKLKMVLKGQNVLAMPVERSLCTWNYGIICSIINQAESNLSHLIGQAALYFFLLERFLQFCRLILHLAAVDGS